MLLTFLRNALVFLFEGVFSVLFGLIYGWLNKTSGGFHGPIHALEGILLLLFIRLLFFFPFNMLFLLAFEGLKQRTAKWYELMVGNVFLYYFLTIFYNGTIFPGVIDMISEPPFNIVLLAAIFSALGCSLWRTKLFLRKN